LRTRVIVVAGWCCCRIRPKWTQRAQVTGRPHCLCSRRRARDQGVIRRSWTTPVVYRGKAWASCHPSRSTIALRRSEQSWLVS